MFTAGLRGIVSETLIVTGSPSPKCCLIAAKNALSQTFRFLALILGITRPSGDRQAPRSALTNSAGVSIRVFLGLATVSSYKEGWDEWRCRRFLVILGTMPPAVSNILVQAHEDRIQRLEDQIPQLSAAVSEVSTKVDGMAGTLASIEQMVSSAATERRTQSSALMARIDTLETAKKVDAIRASERAGIIRSVKKAAVPLSIALTATITKFGESIWAWLTRGHS